tara:strand:+ start:608 stop:1276 length:669 start_codon:yes stop_codon:yes gene_type:complete
MTRNLTPIMLVLGPLMLIAGYASWPITNEVGSEAVSLLSEDATLPLSAVGVLGVCLMFSSLHLLSMDMKQGADGMSKQLLSMADLFIFGTFGLFLIGFGGQIAAIIITNDTTAVFENQAARDAAAEVGFTAAYSIWTLTPVVWGLSMICLGLAHVGLKVPENMTEGAFGLLMPVGFANTMILFIGDLEQAEFNILFPVTMLLYVSLGGLMLAGKIDTPGSAD